MVLSDLHALHINPAVHLKFRTHLNDFWYTVEQQIIKLQETRYDRKSALKKQ